jgi:hypothetical protein
LPTAVHDEFVDARFDSAEEDSLQVGFEIPASAEFREKKTGHPTNHERWNYNGATARPVGTYDGLVE